jgi:exosortase
MSASESRPSKLNQMIVEPPSMLAKRHTVFVAFLAVSAAIFWRPLSSLVQYSLHDDSSSHIVLIPFIVLFLIFTERKKVFADTRSSFGLGTVLILAGVFFYWITARHALANVVTHSLSEAALSIVVIWVGGFAICYGNRAMRAGAFPLLFLLLMVPMPAAILDGTTSYLQQGSTEIAFILFRMLGVPTLRHGFLLSVPGLTIEVARECSSIRSSIALLITCILAVHYFLRTPWKMLLFVALALPLSIVKNGIRIVTLTLLSIYVNPNFMYGDLHRDGGFVFFLLALAMLWPVLVLLQRSERPESRLGIEGAGKAA